MFYRSTFLMNVAITKLKSRGSRLIPREITPIFIRNLFELLGQLGWYLSIKLIPMSTFFILFNTKGIWVYILETFWKRKCPPTMHIVCCVVSVIGTLIVIWPSTSARAEPSRSILSTSFGILGSLMSSVFISISDVYMNHLSELHKKSIPIGIKTLCFSA